MGLIKKFIKRLLRIRYNIKYRVYRSKRINKKSLNKNATVGKVHIYYRTSDAGYSKIKPEYINGFNCLKNALSVFSPQEFDWHILCDGCSEATMEYVNSLCKEYAVNSDNVTQVKVGHGAGTFRLVYEDSLKYDDDDVVYFLENDYLHKDECAPLLKSIFGVNKKVDYMTFYDHSDKYESDFEYSAYYQKTKVFFDGQAHWQSIFATTMTFAAKVRTLKKDKKVFWKWTATKHPYDFQIFIDLKKRTLISPIPGLSTHGEVNYLSPGANWGEIVNDLNK